MRGKRIGRGAEHFFDEGIELENETGDDPFRELARQTVAPTRGSSPVTA